MMTFESLLKFIEEEDKNLKRLYSRERSKIRSVFRLAKLTEEVGELADQILSGLNQQRSSKKRSRGSDTLEEEIADVIIVVLLLAHSEGVDVRGVLQKRMKKIESRRRP